MRFKCPHCQQPIEIVDDLIDDFLITCPACGSSVPHPAADVATQPMGAEQVLGHFVLQEQVGAGQFGVVWKARDAELDRLVAVKIPRKEQLEPGDLEMFLREARAAAQLEHKNIIAIHQVSTGTEKPFIVSQFIAGPNLADWLTNHTVTPRQAAEFCATLARALAHAHERSIIHRDLKPSNILIDENGQLYLTDFGLAKRNAGEATLTMQGRPLGTPAYMSPEQARGDGHKADARSDVYSLGVVLYEMLCGDRPFRGNSHMNLLQQVLHEEPVPPRRLRPSLPRDLETICLRALEKDPDRRFQTAADFAAELDRWLEGRPILSRPVGPIGHSLRWIERNRMLALVSAIAVAAATFATVFALTPGVDGRDLRLVEIATSFNDSRLALIPLSSADGLPQPDRKTLARMSGAKPARVRVLPGDYLVVAWVGDPKSSTLFHEVLRHVPTVEEGPGREGDIVQQWSTKPDGAIALAPVRLHDHQDVTRGMALAPGSSQFLMGDENSGRTPPHKRNVPAFYLDQTEFTAGLCRQLLDGAWPEALRSRANELANDDPLILVDFDYAVAAAESVGKRLLDEAEMEFASIGGETVRPPPTANPDAIALWEVGPVGSPQFDVVNFDKPVTGLFSNVAEWTGSWFAHYPPHAHYPPLGEPRGLRVVRGGDPDYIGPLPDEKLTEAREAWRLGPRNRVGWDRIRSSPQIGFRCARSPHPRLEPADFPAPVVQTEIAAGK